MRPPPPDPALFPLQAIAEHSEDAMVSVDTDGTVVTWNPAAERIFGFPADEAIGSSIARLYPPEKSNELAEIFRRVGEQGQVYRLERMRRTKSGRCVHVALCMVPVKDAGGRIIGMASLSRDITEHREAEAALSEEQAFVSTLLDTAGALVIVLDEIEGRLSVRSSPGRGTRVRVCVPESAGQATRPVASSLPRARS